MHFDLEFSGEACIQLHKLEKNKALQVPLKAVRKTLGLMQVNLRHPSLQTHKFHSISGPDGGDVFESYAQNQTPGAYRVFWCYGPDKGVITVLAIVSHP